MRMMIIRWRLIGGFASEVASFRANRASAMILIQLTRTRFARSFRVDIGCYYKGNISTVFSGKNSSLLASRTRTGTATVSTKVWSVRPQATYVNGGQLGPGMNGTNGTLTLVMPGAAGALQARWAVAFLGSLFAVLGMVVLLGGV
jgi:hypothetical protein